MGWFQEQIEQRKISDNNNFSDALDNIASAIMGDKLKNALDDKELAQNALDEVLKCFHIKAKNIELPIEIKTVDEALEYRLRSHGIMKRRVKLDKDWYKNATGPMLTTLKENDKPVALIPGKLIGYSIVDVTSGNKIKANRKTNELIDNDALCFYNPLPLKSLKISDLLIYMFGQLSTSDITLYLLMMLIVTLLGMLSPLFTKWLFGTVLESKSIQSLLALAVFMVCFSISQMFIGAINTLISQRINTKQSVAVQAAVMNRIMSLPATFFKDYSSGELTQRASYVINLCTTLYNTIGGVGFTSLFSLLYIGQIFTFVPELVVPSLLITILSIALTIITTLSQTRITKKQMLESSKTSGMTYAMITGIQKIKLAGAEKRMFTRWAKQYSKEARLQYNPPMFLKLSGTINLAINGFGGMVLYYLAIKAGVDIANYYAFNTAYAMVSGAFTSLASIVLTIANIGPTLEMARPILEAEPELTEGKEIITSLKGNIEINNVSFRYDEAMPYVLDNLSLKINAGEYVAIVGKTGCGKSTLLRLLLGFEKAQKGSIFYDKKDINRIDLKSLRKKIGTVMQDGKLFLDDIYSNIVITAPELTMDEAWQAAEIASIADDIRQMPMGMYTLISEGQGGISGGQKQRLMIARAVANKPKILMFDEATSALDNITQKKVSEAIDSLKCTRIVIAHRLSTIKHCDRIIVLDQGHIVEEGTYEELLEKKGFFAELVERQRIEIEND